MKLIWRNIWRNRRRTIITMASVFFAVFFCIIYSSFETGTWNRMIENTLNTQAGHIQIHGKGFWEDKVIDNFMFMDAATLAQLEQIDNITNVSPRVETFAMASFETTSKGIAVIGVSPEKEAQKSNLPSRIIRGEYLSETDDGILIGEGLSNFLRADVGDTLALIGQGFQGASAAQLFVVRGIMNLITAEMNNSVAYVTLPAAQQFIDMPDGYSGILISIRNNNRLDETMRVVSSQLSVFSDESSENQQTDNRKLKTENYEILSWHFTMERLLQTSESNRAFLILLMGILYVIVGFGILGTVIMMTNERIREFCVMISLGMSRMRLAIIVSFELFIKSLIGAMLAVIVTLPMAYWFSTHPIQLSGELANTLVQFGMEPIIPFAVDPSIFINQIITILVISFLTVIYPARKILKLNLSKNK
ncbi:MAG: ABC transporter permease [Bacteroidetes bacterium]|nr:ABC transporter permease [Bacteroidota bacterium]MCL2302987.1 ABC transporter permease [Lentimicrobiaceae bacterium]